MYILNDTAYAYYSLITLVGTSLLVVFRISFISHLYNCHIVSIQFQKKDFFLAKVRETRPRLAVLESASD